MALHGPGSKASERVAVGKRPQSVEDRLILLSAATALRRSENEPTAEASPPGQLARARRAYSSRRRLLPTLGPRLIDLAKGKATQEFAAGVADARKQATPPGRISAADHARFMRRCRCRGSLSAAEGPWLGQSLYGEAGRRPSADIDLLVAKEQIASGGGGRARARIRQSDPLSGDGHAAFCTSPCSTERRAATGGASLAHPLV